MTYDRWKGLLSEEHVDHAPDWASVNNAINRLDEKVYTLIFLEDESGSNLGIGGGPSGIVVTLYRESQHLVARHGDDCEKISIVIGGQDGDFPRKNVVTFEQAKNIARAYLQGVDVRTIANWEKG